MSLEHPDTADGFVPSGFFAIRSPMLPFNEIVDWAEGLPPPPADLDAETLEARLTATRAELRSRLRRRLESPEVNEAVYVASSSLHQGLEHWCRDPLSRRGQRAEESLVRYFMRMAGRCSPFGLFAGLSVGTLGTATSIRFRERVSFRRHTRLDMDCLHELCRALERNPEVSAGFRFIPNSSLYTAAGRIRFVEDRTVRESRLYKLVAVDAEETLIAILNRARTGATRDELTAWLVENVADAGESDCRAFIDEMIESQLLVFGETPAITGADPLQVLITDLAGQPGAAATAACLSDVAADLKSMDAEPFGGPLERYRNVARRLANLPAPVDEGRLFQVDLVKPVEAASLGPEPIAEIRRGIRLLHDMAAYNASTDPCVAFREEFRARYGDREVRLTEVLDHESGIGFQKSAIPASEAPLLQGIAFLNRPVDTTLIWKDCQATQLRLLIETIRQGRYEMSIPDSELDNLRIGTAPPLPDAFYAVASLWGRSDEAIAAGEFRVSLDFATGPSGAALLGRFCHADSELLKEVRRHLRSEEALEPDAVFAEIVHLPESRHGNVIARPVLRDYEIVYLARSGAPRERQIPVTDLHVSIVGNRVVLRSARLNREVIPRLSCAHNAIHPRNLSMYRFLNVIQRQHRLGGVLWEWGAMKNEPFLPRVVSGRLVLCRARWYLSGAELAHLRGLDRLEQYRTLQNLRRDRGMPRFVAVDDDERGLPIDFDNVLSVETFLAQLKAAPGLSLVELVLDVDELAARGAEGAFVHELVVPFVRSGAPRRNAAPAARLSVRPQSRSFAPGSEWLYVKLYTGSATADRVLRDAVSPIVEDPAFARSVDRWYFLRYGDPDWHLRLRFRGTPAWLLGELAPRLESAVSGLPAGSVHRVQFDTYEREIVRYGGEEGMDLSERVFQADSRATLDLLKDVTGDSGADLRWQLALLTFCGYLDVMGITGEDRAAFLTNMSGAFRAEFDRKGSQMKFQMDGKYRELRGTLESLLNPAAPAVAAHEFARQAARRRDETLRPIMDELLRLRDGGGLTVSWHDLAASYTHMAANRLLRSQARAQEFVIWDILSRKQASQAIQAQRGGNR